MLARPHATGRRGDRSSADRRIPGPAPARKLVSAAVTYRADIDGLRALAIIAVVAYHVGLPGVDGGFVGVDVFFVISGYLITTLLWGELRRSGRVSWADFYARRVRRLLPAMVVVVLASSRPNARVTSNKRVGRAAWLRLAAACRHTPAGSRG